MIFQGVYHGTFYSACHLSSIYCLGSLDAWHNCTVTSEAIENLIADIQHVEKLTVEMAMDCYVETYDNGFSIGEKT